MGTSSTGSQLETWIAGKPIDLLNYDRFNGIKKILIWYFPEMFQSAHPLNATYKQKLAIDFIN